MREIYNALNPWYLLYLFVISGIMAVTNFYPGITGFLAGLTAGLYIKNRDAWKSW